jgi:hypothetical protein
LVHND